jgi:hypothetical protein
VASVYIPRVGVYDSADPRLIDYHILSAKAAGIRGFVVDWYGPGNAVDLAMQVLVARAEALDFQIAVCLEEKTWFPHWADIRSREEAVALASKDLRYFLETYGDSPAMWRQDGLLPVFLFSGWDETPGLGPRILQPAEWRTVRAAMPRQDWRLVRQGFGADYGADVGAFAWVGDADYQDRFARTGEAMLAEGTLGIVVAGANPGFDSHGTWGWGDGPTVVDRAHGEHYQQWWQSSAAGAAVAVQIATWNDFAEGTVIEPTAEFGTAWLDLTERHVGQVSGRPVDLADNELPYRWWYVSGALAAAGVRDLPPVADWLAAGKADRAAAAIDRLVTQHGLTVPPLIRAADEFPPRLYTRPIGAAERQALARIAEPRGRIRPLAVSASSQEAAGFPAAHTVDGDPHTRWASAHRDAEWLALDLGAAHREVALDIIWETAHPAALHVEVSDDGVDWRPVYRQTVDSAAPSHIVVRDAPFRHLRLIFPARATEWGVSIWELGLHTP